MAAAEILSPTEFSTGTGGKISAADPRVKPLLDGATAGIRRYCGWDIGPAPLVETDRYMDGEGGRLLVLPTMRLISVTALSLRGSGHVIDGVSTDPWTTLTADELEDLEWSENGEIHRYCWPRRFRSIKISYTHGFEDVTALKAIIQQVVGNAINSPFGATREQAGALSVSWSTTAPGVSGGISLLDRDLLTVNSYKLPGRA